MRNSYLLSFFVFFNSCLARNNRILIYFPGVRKDAVSFSLLCTVGKSSRAGYLDCTVRPEATSTGHCWLGVRLGWMLISCPLWHRDALWGCAGPCWYHPWGLGIGLLFNTAFQRVQACEMFWKLHIPEQPPLGCGGFLLVIVLWALFPPRCFWCSYSLCPSAAVKDVCSGLERMGRVRSRAAQWGSRPQHQSCSPRLNRK